MDDSAIYTGIDKPQGVFDNEIKDDDVEDKIQEQEKLIQEITPKLNALISAIDKEIDEVNSIKRFRTATMRPEVDIRAELQAAALYEEYLQGLKTQFKLALQRKNDNG